jgi:hypothetical protein
MKKYREVSFPKTCIATLDVLPLWEEIPAVVEIGRKNQE